MRQAKCTELSEMKGKGAELWNLVGDLVRSFRNDLDERLKRAGIRLIEFKIMRLAETEDLTMNEIARELSITKSGITFLTDSLEKKGMIKRVKDRSDRRVNILALTRRGKMTLKKAKVIYNECVRSKTAMLSSEEVETFIELTLKLLGRKELPPVKAAEIREM